MKRTLYLTILCLVLIIIASCNSLDLADKDRDLTLSGKTVNEKAYGGCERWYAVDKYSNDFIEDILFQVGYFKANNIGFVLHGDSTYGEETSFKREGLNLRWDWDETVTGYRYSFIIEPDGTGLYYDFSTLGNGTANPSGIYRCKKF